MLLILQTLGSSGRMVELQREQEALWWGTGVSELGVLWDMWLCGCCLLCHFRTLLVETWGAAWWFWGSLELMERLCCQSVTCGVGLGKTRLAYRLQTKGTVAARLTKTNRNEVKAAHTSTYSSN